jgi:hypothetical protein
MCTAGILQGVHLRFVCYAIDLHIISLQVLKLISVT